MKIENKKTSIIIGAGPAGLTAAYELVHKTDIKPIIFEGSKDIGGISKTVNYKGNRIDIGGHRFFSKSDRVMQWWQNILPIEKHNTVDNHNIMLIRTRLSRIFFLRKFFNYPISLNLNTLRNLGLLRIIKIGISYFSIAIFPKKKEKSLEEFFINRFGKELYRTFFRDYTEKVWGVPCTEIEPEWGAQRIKGLSITKAFYYSIKNIFWKDKSIDQKNTETSLIDQFMYPKFGPGHLWERVAEIIKNKGGEIHLNKKAVGFETTQNQISKIEILDISTQNIQTYNADYYFSSMPVVDLINSMKATIPQNVKEIANGLVYRDFITVGLLLKKLKISNKTKISPKNNLIPDNWIYIQESDVKIGRLQIFNNWSPYLVKDENTVWIGLEYFCNEGDDLWQKSDEEFKKFAAIELAKIDIIDIADVLDSVIIRMRKTYPAYFGTYNQFDIIRNFTDKIENLFLVGRNGMHRYNNQDHSMLTAITAVENIINGKKTKENIWEINTEQDYHEEKEG
ncbi:MAG: NAD(P)/FAD-dependent oxidoreductase [Bacteroidetes bacterium]|jgi:protoporphyrinogen oxidase|nr:NAD(P)/FAD-dependent oxidoreductase [Bacteroidota bacterium]MBT6684701.1 NAD(P)/FAD-dependent oxidoreductase [Bacteroidota bacterium]MBT7143174.1 NAD(P)/FAD-dependent oxidoreductase [Bacteroidota bacterium]MBT7492617.1 NAD(P)/FAD-dependent oxidoreductase [Bacteroidota bacterium]